MLACALGFKTLDQGLYKWKLHEDSTLPQSEGLSLANKQTAGEDVGKGKDLHPAGETVSCSGHQENSMGLLQDTQN